METLIEVFRDPHFLSDRSVHLLEKIVKPMLDEYIPLHALLIHLSGVSAKLMVQSNSGPDGVITFEDGFEMTVQIVTSHHDKSEGLGRRQLSEGKPYWPNMTLSERGGNGTRRVLEKGSAFTTPAARTTKLVNGVETALHKKIAKFKTGTHALLIGGEMSLHDESWKIAVRVLLDSVRPNPYARIFVGDTRGIYIDYQLSERQLPKVTLGI